jgi:hypothetical protein
VAAGRQPGSAAGSGHPGPGRSPGVGHGPGQQDHRQQHVNDAPELQHVRSDPGAAAGGGVLGEGCGGRAGIGVRGMQPGLERQQHDPEQRQDGAGTVWPAGIAISGRVRAAIRVMTTPPAGEPPLWVCGFHRE